MSRLTDRGRRRAAILSIRLRLVRHGRSIVSTLILLAWLAGLGFALPVVADFAEQDTPGFGLVVLYIALSALALAWCESDG